MCRGRDLTPPSNRGFGPPRQVPPTETSTGTGRPTRRWEGRHSESVSRVSVGKTPLASVSGSSPRVRDHRGPGELYPTLRVFRGSRSVCSDVLDQIPGPVGSPSEVFAGPRSETHGPLESRGGPETREDPSFDGPVGPGRRILGTGARRGRSGEGSPGRDPPQVGRRGPVFLTRMTEESKYTVDSYVTRCTQPVTPFPRLSGSVLPQRPGGGTVVPRSEEGWGTNV